MRIDRTRSFCCFTTLCAVLLLTHVTKSADPIEVKDATTWAMHVISDIGDGHDGTRIADVNGDGLMDVVTGCEESHDVIVCLHPGHDGVRSKWPQVVVGKCKGVEDAVFVDLDADGNVDVVACCESNQVIVCWAPKHKDDYLDAAKWRQEPIPAAKGGSMMFCVPVQVDGRNGVDLVIGGKKNSGIYWLESPADPRDLSSYKKHPIGKGRWIMSLFWRDMDGDGDGDVCYTDRTHLAWLQNPGIGPEQSQPWRRHMLDGQSQEKADNLGLNFRFMDMIDFDGDGLEDIVAPSRPGTIFYRRLDKSGTNWEQHTIAPIGPKAVAAADLNGDGRMEVVSSYPYHIFKYEADSYEPTILPIMDHNIGKADLVKLLDLDGDGDVDVLSSSERSDTIFWLENPHISER